MTGQPRFLGFTPDGRRRSAADYEMLLPTAGGPDPDSDDKVDASADDADEDEDSGDVVITPTTIPIISGSSGRKWGGLRFHNGPFPAKGSTIDVAYIQWYIYSDTYDDANFDIYAEDGASPSAFTTDAHNITGRTRTEHSEAWVANDLGWGWKESPSIVSVIQELATDYDSTVIVLILKAKTDATKDLRFRSWDNTATPANTWGATLHLEWTEGGPPVGQPTMRRWGGVPGMVYTGRGAW